MGATRQVCGWVMFAGVLTGIAPAAQAIMVYDNPAGNASAPAGGQGWQHVGRFAGAGGVAISPSHFIATQHQGGSVGGQFQLNGTNYTTTGFTNIANSDLRIWSVSGTFASYAPIYTQTPVAGQAVTLIGYGIHTLGAAVTTSNPPPNDHGWLWGATTGKSWGLNEVDWVGTLDGRHYLRFDFDPVANQGTYGTGDSGGGVFVNDGGVWKLAGIHVGVQIPWAYEDGGATFNAAIYEAGGIWWRSSGGTYFQMSGGQAMTAMYLNGYASELFAVIPEPGAIGLLAPWFILVLRRRAAVCAVA